MVSFCLAYLIYGDHFTGFRSTFLFFSQFFGLFKPVFPVACAGGFDRSKIRNFYRLYTAELQGRFL